MMSSRKRQFYWRTRRPTSRCRSISSGRILQHTPQVRVRATTTQSAAIELGAAPASRASLARELAPWCLAAACFAFAVFEWRSAAVLGPQPESAAAPQTAAADLATSTGQQAATLAWDPAARTGTLRIHALPPRRASAPFEHRTFWGRSTEGSAVVLASRVCAGACSESDFWTVASSVPLRQPLDTWMTAAPSDGTVDLQEASVLLSTRWPRRDD